MIAPAAQLAALRGSLSRFDQGCGPAVPLGHAEADAVLQGGLRTGAMHEVFADEGRHGVTATGFAAALAVRASGNRAILWIRQDFAAREIGDLAMTGFIGLGLDPRRIVVVRAADGDSALRASTDCLACNALGAVVLDLWGEVKGLDLIASRKLTLAAQASGVTNIILRVAAEPRASTAETRWLVRAAPSRATEAFGAPIFETELLRNRHGRTGQFIMEWNGDDCLFSEACSESSSSIKTHPRAVAAVSADRPAATAEPAPGAAPEFAQWRRAG